MHCKLPSVNHSTYTFLGEAAEFVKVDRKWRGVSLVSELLVLLSFS
jgi:hypothetical protein